MATTKDRVSNGIVNRLGYVGVFAFVGIPVLAALAWQPEQVRQAHAVLVPPEGAADDIQTDPECAETQASPVDRGGFSDVEAANRFSADTGYNVVCCGYPGRDTCMYYVGHNACPNGTTQISCPCRQTRE